MNALTGGCQCSRVRFTARTAERETELCHCSLCRRAVGNIHMTSVSVPKADVQWTGEAATYASSPIATRGFCPNCGTPLWFAYNDSAKMDLMAGAIDQIDQLRPGRHFGVESRLEAFRNTENLPEERTDSVPAIVERWRAATGHGPA